MGRQFRDRDKVSILDIIQLRTRRNDVELLLHQDGFGISSYSLQAHKFRWNEDRGKLRTMVQPLISWSRRIFRKPNFATSPTSQSILKPFPEQSLSTNRHWITQIAGYLSYSTLLVRQDPFDPSCAADHNLYRRTQTGRSDRY
jgi:hypothetical protein